MALTIAGVGHTYGDGTPYAFRALRGVDLQVEPGQLAVVLGATGSGKSTLLQAAAGILAPTEGSVQVDGVDAFGAKSGSPRGRVGLVFQRPESQLFAETVADDVAFGPRNLGRTPEEARADANVALRLVALDPDAFAGRSPFTLSGGEARRVALAGVLAMRPDYLLLDEPTAGLDAQGREAVTAAVAAARAGAGAVVVTHDPEEFLETADVALVLADGEAVFHGPASALLADPAPLMAAGLATPPVLRVQLLAREAGAPVSTLTLDPVAAAATLADGRRP